MNIIHFIRRAGFVLFALPALALMTGCDEIDQMHDNAAKRPPVGSTELVDAAGNAPSTPAATPANPPAAQQVEIVSTEPAATPPATTPAPTLEPAGAGQGTQGQGYGGGIITEPVHQYFHMRDRITFDIQIKKQLQLWKAMNNNRNPKNVAEYKKEILDPCQIELPELPPGKRYVYDAKKGELLVESGGPAQ